MDPFSQYASPYAGMGNDPVNLVDPSGGISIPLCPGISPLGAFFAKAGDFAGNTLSSISSITNAVTIASSISAAGSNIYNNNVQFKIIDGQLAGNMTMQVGMDELGANSLMFGNFEGDEDGDGAELLFKTVIGAAKHWGKTYNDNSIVEEVEYGSTIYEEVINKTIYYKYSIPNRAASSGASVKVSNAPAGRKVVADIHSHGNSWGESPGVVAADNNFSNIDKWSNYKKKIDGYLTTPDGSLKKYNYRTAKTSDISTDMPSDPKYPKIRKNNIDPFKLPKNEPSVLMR